MKKKNMCSTSDQIFLMTFLTLNHFICSTKTQPKAMFDQFKQNNIGYYFFLPEISLLLACSNVYRKYNNNKNR